MLISELIEELQNDLKSFGDREVVLMGCEHLVEDEPMPIHGIGWYGGKDGNGKTFIECWECHDDAMRDKCADDGLPDEAFYPDDEYADF